MLELSGLRLTTTTHAPRQRTPPHQHEYFCLHFVLSGTYDESYPGATFRLGPAEILYKPAGCMHWNDFRAGGSRSLRLEFYPAVDPVLAGLLPSSPRLFRSANYVSLLHQLQQQLRRPVLHGSQVARALSLDILTCVAATPADDERSPSTVALRCLRWIDDRFTGAVGLAEAAAALGVNRGHLARAFRKSQGCSVGEYVRWRRVQYVASALRDRDHRPLSLLAFDAGFADQAHMTRCFKSLRGITPGLWRRLLLS